MTCLEEHSRAASPPGSLRALNLNLPYPLCPNMNDLLTFARKPPMFTSQTKYRAPALEKGLEILEYLSQQGEPQTVSQITAAISKTRSEIYRMLMVLEDRGYLIRAEDGDRLMVTNKLFELGIKNPPLANLHDAAMPHMHRLSEDLFQACHLAVRSEMQIVCVARVESPGQLGFSVRLGFSHPMLHSTSGVVLYAFASSKQQQQWKDDMIATAAKREEVDSFLGKAEEAHSKGYIVLPSDVVEGIQDIGAPIFAPNAAAPRASLTMPFVSGRGAKTSLETATKQVTLAAQRISSELSGETLSQD